MLIFISIVLSINIIFLVIVAINRLSGIWIKPKSLPKGRKSSPSVSVLIPARDEIKNLPASLPTVKNLDYPELNIIYLDDASSDGTSDFIQTHSDQRITLIEGGYSSNSLRGKTNALDQLQKFEKLNIDSEYVVFTDADDILNPQIISTSIQIMDEKKLDMMSLFPEQKFGNILEKLFSPITDIILYTLLPLILVEKISIPSLSAANGQWIAIKRNVFDEIGGFAAVGNSITEDTDLARLVKRKGYKAGVYSGINLISTRMYEKFSDIYNGFTKNLYGIAGGNALATISMGLIYGICGIGSIISLFMIDCYPIALLPYLTILFWRGLISEKLGHGILSVFLFPLTSLFMLVTSVASAYKVPRKLAIWKGRKV